jgi:hypothetical protein
MNQNQHDVVRLSVIQEAVRRIFQGNTHLPPVVFAERAWGWSPSHTYKYTSLKGAKQFPLPLTRVGGQKRVSEIEFFNFLSGGNPSHQSDFQSFNHPLKRPGRPTNAEVANARQLTQRGGV